MKTDATLAQPRNFALRIVPCGLPKPKTHSIIVRQVCDVPQPGYRVMRSSMAEPPFRVSGFVHGHMRRDAFLAQCGDMAARVAALVYACRDAALFVCVSDLFERLERRIALRRSRHRRDRACEREAVTVLITAWPI
ncbi:MAG: hypothetical protein OEU68_06375 [Nitrospira sp.]|nr:hypothetical protein [Nitrospira sp.]MDH4244128.1 hypothetical protein [Nitrospira sp.]MDH4355982.1 hypothetical protein [Nitrospira sp.]MDH5317782.1 hypothetical protein [Nitrospira sp.]